jgi:hypothetical protein
LEEGNRWRGPGLPYESAAIGPFTLLSSEPPKPDRAIHLMYFMVTSSNLRDSEVTHLPCKRT